MNPGVGFCSNVLPPAQIRGLAQTPQFPPQPSFPQTFPEHAGLQWQTPAVVQSYWVLEQVPQLPPHPSSPQPLPVQSALHLP